MEFSDKELEVTVLMKENAGKCKEYFLASVKKHRFKLPSDCRFDREELHERSCLLRHKHLDIFIF